MLHQDLPPGAGPGALPRRRGIDVYGHIIDARMEVFKPLMRVPRSASVAALCLRQVQAR